MKIDAALLCQRIEEAGPLARRLEALGFDGAYTYEGAHDPSPNTFEKAGARWC